MKTYCQFVICLFAMLTSALIGITRAEEQKPESPAGYGQAEQADEPAESTKKKKLLDQKGDEKDDKKDGKNKESDVPTGYEDTEQAGKSPKKARQVIVVPAVPVANDEKQLDPKELFKKNPQLKALADQMRAQIQPLFGAELTFAKNVCQPNEEQFKKMKTLATPEFKKALQSFVVQQAPMMGIQLGGIRARPRQQQAAKIYDDFEAAASRIVANVFPEEAVKLYQAEQNHRREFRARSSAMTLVAHLDTQFRLSQDQREKLTDSLQKVWRREWQQYMQIMPSNPQFFPPVPDESVVPHLSEVQIKRWKSMQRNQLGMNWQNINNQGHFRELQPEIDWFDEQNNAAAANFIQIFNAGVFAVEAVAVEPEAAAEEDDE